MGLRSLFLSQLSMYTRSSAPHRQCLSADVCIGIALPVPLTGAALVHNMSPRKARPLERHVPSKGTVILRPAHFSSAAEEQLWLNTIQLSLLSTRQSLALEGTDVRTNSICGPCKRRKTKTPTHMCGHRRR